MAAMLDLLQSTSGFTSENSLSGVPTPPYTPFRPGKRSRLERSDSPASVRSGSIHPHETESPANKPAKKRIAVDNIKVEELPAEDVGYMADVDGILPYETESADDSSNDDNDHDDDDDTATDVSGDEAGLLARKLSQMDCTDDRDNFLKDRQRRRRRERRSGVNHTKRTHSLANESIAEPTDVEALGDHDYEAGQRRLRRRTRGPDEMGYVAKDETELGQHSEAGASIAGSPVVEVEVMDVDEDDVG